GVMLSGSDEPLQLRNDLVGRFDPRAASENDDDVAELAGERTAARDLDAAVQVFVHRQQVPPRWRHSGHIGFVGLLVTGLVPALAPLSKKARPGLLGLADEHDIDQSAEILGIDRDPRPAEHGEYAAPLQLEDNLAHAPALDRHAGDADNVGASASFKIDLFDIFVDDRNRMLGRGKRGDRGKVERGNDRLLAKQRQGVVDAPKGRIKARIDQNDLGHASTRYPYRLVTVRR